MGNAETLPENAYYHTLCYIFELIMISTDILIISQITSSKLCGYNKVTWYSFKGCPFLRSTEAHLLIRNKPHTCIYVTTKLVYLWQIPTFMLDNLHISISYLRILFITKILEQLFLNQNTISNLHYLIKPPVYF